MNDARVALVRQAIFTVLDEREWNFSDDEQRVDFADRVLTFVPSETATTVDRREIIQVLRLAEAMMGAAVAQGTLTQCVTDPQAALERIMDVRKRIEA